jgi:hypothetical protein
LASFGASRLAPRAPRAETRRSKQTGGSQFSPHAILNCPWQDACRPPCGYDFDRRNMSLWAWYLDTPQTAAAGLDGQNAPGRESGSSALTFGQFASRVGLKQAEIWPEWPRRPASILVDFAGCSDELEGGQFPWSGCPFLIEHALHSRTCACLGLMRDLLRSIVRYVLLEAREMRNRSAGHPTSEHAPGGS